MLGAPLRPLVTNIYNDPVQCLLLNLTMLQQYKLSMFVMVLNLQCLIEPYCLTLTMYLKL
jgi:hypothetical protein